MDYNLDYNVAERIRNLIDSKIPPLDIIHGELKTLMLEAETQLEEAQAAEDESEEAMDSMERKYWEGYSEALADIYGLTYQLSFAIQED